MVWIVIAVCLALAGCSLPSLPTLGGPGGELQVTSSVDAAVQAQYTFDTGVYSHNDSNTLTAVLFDGPADNPRAALTVRMFWEPRAAHTPIDPAATNATMHFIVFDASGGARQVAVYSGAGFMYPYSNVGEAKLRGGVWEANLRLSDASRTFEDAFGQAVIRGEFTAVRDAAATEQALHRLRVLVQEALGYPRLVRADVER